MTVPLLIILAGPNGSGKSTLCGLPAFQSVLKERSVFVINPDDIARVAPADSNPLIWSGREVHRIIEEALQGRKSILVETTLSGKNHFKTLEAAKAAGYETALHFVFVSNIALAKQRVALRVKLGGHDVPELDQERRYNKSLQNAVQLIGQVDEAIIYLNDFETRNHEVIAEYRSGLRIAGSNENHDWLP